MGRLSLRYCGLHLRTARLGPGGLRQAHDVRTLWGRVQHVRRAVEGVWRHLPGELLTALGEGRGWLLGLGGGQHLAGKSCKLHIENNVKVPTDPLLGLVPRLVPGQGVLLLVQAVVQGQLLHLQGRRSGVRRSG